MTTGISGDYERQATRDAWLSRRRFLFGLGAAVAAAPFASLIAATPALADNQNQGQGQNDGKNQGQGDGQSQKDKDQKNQSVRNIPVLAYHQLDNDPDVESVSSTIFDSNLAYLHSAGYQTITAAQYVAWIQGKNANLPSKPLLITADDGIINIFDKGTPILRRYGFKAVAFIVTGFADGATSGNPLNAGWNMTWSQLRAADSKAWEFAFHAGAQGHNVETYNPLISYFYAARMPGETDSQFEQRVFNEIRAGRLEFASKLSSKTVNNSMWAVPWNDVGQPGQLYDGPAGWLERWASDLFPVVFLQDSARNGVMSERFRFEVQGWMTETYFEDTLAGFIASGSFDR
jgi:hypothetical protein